MLSFPESERVVYQKNPLIEVICQLRFARILEIDRTPPVEVQDQLRTEYPQLETRPGVELAFPVSSTAPPVALARGVAYEFSSRDGAWRFVLAPDFCALTTSRYIRWEEFRERLWHAVQVVAQRYRIPYFTRVGLRYQDLIVRSELGLADTPWRELLRVSVAGLLADPDVQETYFDEALSVALLNLGEADAKCRVRHGLARKPDNPEFAYLIDADFFTETPRERHDACNLVDQFNRRAGHFFRWCITPQLHQAMGPQPIG
ncbi:MAG: hypothetical protein KatS3mg110_4077 [Pirellulaceae bacterium]|nr:MAG: hypothetical protein KatS3mg110_4077 [Pirellulaceae bacterium]